MNIRQPASIDLSLIIDDSSSSRVSVWILQKLQRLDEEWGAANWSALQIAIVTCIVLGPIKFLCKEKYGVTWWGFFHAIVSGYGSLACVWVSTFSAETLTGTSEPLRSVLCQGPLTSLHRIIPAIAMGYGVFDTLEGFTHGIDFILHGVATFSIMSYFCYYNVAEIIVPMLLMEISTVHLNLMKATFLSETGIAINMAFFVVFFFLTRLLICPYLWYGIFMSVHQNVNNPISQECLPWHFQYIVFLFGMFFHCLNAFWGYKIIRKLKRKLTGMEKVQERNNLKDE